jgi:hypothetical protein
VSTKYYAQQLAENETGKVDILVGFYACQKGFISRIRDLMKIVSCIQTM